MKPSSTIRAEPTRHDRTAPGHWADFSALVCPACKGPLELIEASGAGADPALRCTRCDVSYPIARGIPRFVGSDEYAGNFSLEWKVHRRTQLDGEEGRLSDFHFHERFGLPLEFWKDKQVLDVGVGVGRYARVAAAAGADVWGIDLSYAVDVARENLADFPTARLAQANAYELPFAPETFDVIYSFGVLHHMPDPHKAFLGLIPLLKPGGIICITVYPNEGMYHSSRYLRRVTTQLPPAVLYPLAAAATAVFYLPYRYLGLRYGFLGRLAPISLSPNFREAVLDTFDCYSPKYQFTYSDYDIFEWFRKAGLHDIAVRPERVTVLGRK